MTEIIFEKHPESGRHCIVDDDAGTIWMYLTEESSLKPVADVWVANSSLTEPRNDRTAPPRAPERVTITGGAAPIDYKASSWRIDWSSDGHAATLFKDDIVLAKVDRQSKFGFNRNLSMPSPFGSPLTEEAE